MPSIPKPRLRRAARAASVERAAPPAEPRIEVVEHDGLRWINIEQPGTLEQAWLGEHFEFHPLDLEDVRSRNQRPKMDEYEDYLFIVLNFPVFDKTAGRLNAGELDIFIGPDYLITLPNSPLAPVEYLFERCRSSEETRDQLMSKGPGLLLYKIVDDSFDYCFPMLRKMGNKLDRIEDEIFEGAAEDVVRDISNAKQEIINFRKIIRPQRTVLRDLERNKQRYLAEDLDIYFDDIVDASERIWDMLENYKEVVEALEQTNESVISHRVNGILRVLTAFSVIILPLTLIASIWGMNVGVPGEGGETAFWVIVADGGRARGDARLLPPPPLALTASVVIATRNRHERLNALLESLADQDTDVEVVVVEDTDGRGPAAVRNIGWRRANGELICFVDDDVVLDRGWARALLDAHRQSPDAVLQGRTEPHPAEAAAQDAFSRSKAITEFDWNYQTCNIAYPRALLERLGGFDEAYRFASAEDTDLGWRAREAGAPIRFVNEAHAWHAVQRLGVLRLVQRMRIKTDVARLTRRHPGLRHHYYRQIFWKPSHAFLPLAAAGLALAPRTRGASLVLAAPYVRLYRGQHGSYPGTVASLPGHGAVDGAEMAAIVAGAVRFRTLLV